MTRDEELRARLEALDPLRARQNVDPLPPPSAAEIKERVMQTINHPDHATSVTPPARRRRWQMLSAAAAAVIIAASLAVAVNVGSGDSDETTKQPTTLALKVPDSNVMSSCVPFNVEFLRDMSPAFAGTVAAVDEDAVTLKVDRWYKGGPADHVRVSRPDPQSTLALDGVEFEKGKRYLVTAADGTLNGCGFSGEATPELEKAFDEAFAR